MTSLTRKTGSKTTLVGTRDVPLSVSRTRLVYFQARVRKMVSRLNLSLTTLITWSLTIARMKIKSLLKTVRVWTTWSTKMKRKSQFLLKRKSLPLGQTRNSSGSLSRCQQMQMRGQLSKISRFHPRPCTSLAKYLWYLGRPKRRSNLPI